VDRELAAEQPGDVLGRRPLDLRDGAAWRRRGGRRRRQREDLGRAAPLEADRHADARAAGHDPVQVAHDGLEHLRETPRIEHRQAVAEIVRVVDGDLPPVESAGELPHDAVCDLARGHADRHDRDRPHVLEGRAQQLLEPVDRVFEHLRRGDVARATRPTLGQEVRPVVELVKVVPDLVANVGDDALADPRAGGHARAVRAHAGRVPVVRRDAGQQALADAPARGELAWHAPHASRRRRHGRCVVR